MEVFKSKKFWYITGGLVTAVLAFFVVRRVAGLPNIDKKIESAETNLDKLRAKRDMRDAKLEALAS